MARINIDDEWFTDSRRTKLITLVGDEHAADGLMVSIWSKAQYFWRNGQKPIPKPEFFKIPRAQLVLDCGLAVRRGASIYVRGSLEKFQWLFERKMAGQAGGLAKARNQKEKILANLYQTPSKPLASSSISSSNTNTSSYPPTPLKKGDETMGNILDKALAGKGLDDDLAF